MNKKELMDKIKDLDDETEIMVIVKSTYNVNTGKVVGCLADCNFLELEIELED